jgi:replicative DNA helicase
LNRHITPVENKEKTYCVNRELQELLIQNIRKSEEAIVYLDENESLTYEDKISILKRHSQKHNIEDIVLSWFIAIYTKTVYFIPSKSLSIP